MSLARIHGWQDVEAEVLRRIHRRDWAPGEIIPTEADLAQEFGCARATVNRALRAVAEAGLLDRRRKAGTRVALHPVRKATLEIPMIRADVEGSGRRHGYRLIRSDIGEAPDHVRHAMGGAVNTDLLHILALHFADARPFVIEDRWVNPATVPAIAKADLTAISANEWLLTHAPYTGGDIVFSAQPASESQADLLECALNAALFTIHRTTWDHDTAITHVRLTYAPGHALRTTL